MKKIPIYNLLAFSCGFYVGYVECKGINIENNLENMLKYGPTMFTVVNSILVKKINYSTKRWIYNNSTNKLNDGSLEIILEDNKKIQFKYLTKEQKEELLPNLLNGIKKLTPVNKTNYIKSSLIVGAKTGIVTYAGYISGRIYGGLI
jgi:hypothetical protein